MRFLLRLALLLLIGLVAYNYFFGDESEREESTQVIESVRQLGSSVVDLVVSEKERISAGKYSEVMDKAGNSIGMMRENKEEFNIQDSELESLERDKMEIDSLIYSLENHAEGESEEESYSELITSKIQDLMQKLKELTNQE